MTTGLCKYAWLVRYKYGVTEQAVLHANFGGQSTTSVLRVAVTDQ